MTPAPRTGAAEDPPEILLDLSRLISRIRHRTPTGVDRVELAYAEGLLATVPERLRFCAVHPTGLYGRLPTRTAQHFIAATRAAWDGGHVGESAFQNRVRLLRTLWAMRPRRLPPPRPRVLIQSSPHHLHNEPLVRTILRREQARLVCLLHDLIPIEFPEYARPNGKALHLRRIHTVARLASATIANSQATLDSFRPYVVREGRDIPLHVAHLGLDHVPETRVGIEATPPVFVCLGTIEARKNHLLLLNIWRRLAETHPPETLSKLVIIGRRGWENEQVIDMLERCPALAGCVEEYSGLPDGEVQARLANATALLLPSFAEGFGMPVTEALAAGTPVICSNLPALREAGGEAPDYLDPLDGLGWQKAIMDYSQPGSARRAAQQARIAHWRAPTWQDHVRIVLKAVEGVS